MKMMMVTNLVKILTKNSKSSSATEVRTIQLRTNASRNTTTLLNNGREADRMLAKNISCLKLM